MAIHIIQWLCPSRHAIVCTAYDTEETTDDLALVMTQDAIEKAVKSGSLDPWCGICGSRELKYETRNTKFKTMEEAKPELERLEFENLASRMAIDRARGSRN